MTRFEALVALNIAGIGNFKLGKLLEFFGMPQEILKAPVEKLIGACGVGEKLANRIHSSKDEDLKKRFLFLFGF